MQWVLTTLTIGTGLLSLVGTLVSLPFTPARIWSSRLRKHMENVKALDAERHPNQHEVLMRRADHLANKVAAAYHIKADWETFRWAAIQFAFFVYLAVALVLQWIYLPQESYLQRPVGLLMIVLYVALQTVIGRVQVAKLRSIGAHRAEFIAQGCPPDFPTAPGCRRTVFVGTTSAASEETPTSLRAEAADADYPSINKDATALKSRAIRRFNSAPEESSPRFVWVWLAQHCFWFLGAQATLFAITFVLIFGAAFLNTTVPQPLGSILLVTTAALTFGSVIPLAAYVWEVRRRGEGP